MRAAIRKTQTPFADIARDSPNWKMRVLPGLTAHDTIPQPGGLVAARLARKGWLRRCSPGIVKVVIVSRTLDPTGQSPRQISLRSV
jgi:hypothetical protein